MNLSVWLERAARIRATQPALLTGTRIDADYLTFAKRASAIARSLRQHFGVKAGDRIGILMDNRTEYLEVLFGIWWGGAVAVPINAKLHPREAAWIIADSGCRIVFVNEDRGDKLESLQDEMPALERILAVEDPSFERWRNSDGDSAPAPCAGDDLAWLFYTSGTTGKPKGAMLSWANLQAMAYCYFTDVARIDADDAYLFAAPLSHGAGLYMLPHLLVGTRQVVPASGGFDPEEILDLAKSLRDLTMFAAPTMVRRLVEHARATGADGDGVKTVVYGGGPMYLADIEDALQVLGPRFAQIYGQGETPMTITALAGHWHAENEHPRFRERLASVGLPMSAVEVDVTDAAGRSLPPGEPGAIRVKGATVMQGYWRNSEATAEALQDGWLDTGDVGVFDADGFLSLRDRSKDLIISGGSNIYPREVEEVLLRHESVAEAAVIGRPHPDWGEEVVAFIVPKTGLDLDEPALDAWCKEHIARYKRPRAYRKLDALPKNNYGKVLKTELRTVSADSWRDRLGLC